MRFFWYAIYDYIIIPSFWLIIHAASPFDGKIRRAIRGRRTLFESLEANVRRLSRKRRVWVHSSSMGEFEQAKPIIAALRKKHKDIHIVVSFFSPSGFDHSKNFPLADIITYIPFDTASNAERFVDLVRPNAAVMMRYDVWPNHVRALRARNIPVFIANATMRPTSARMLAGIRSFHRMLYDDLSGIFTVSRRDVEAFGAFGLKTVPVEAIGETRYDQVWQRSEEAKKKHLIAAAILKKRRVFVVGSSWPEDEAILLPTFTKILKYDPSVLMILVPHEPTLEAIEAIETSLGQKPRSIRFSNMNDYNNEPIIIVDSIGILTALYQYADIAYVGGSFRQGVHNVLEPAVYGIPVLYGPKHENSQEAIELARRGGGFVVRDQQDCYRTLRTLFTDQRERTHAGAESAKLVKENIGATERLLAKLEPFLK
jgi:3-deoxy-D-manno-octulosonic-acid transferase